jgi:CRP-like cAMP-binding protein
MSLESSSAKQFAFIALKTAMEAYAPLTDETWGAFRALCKFRTINKQGVLYQAGEVPNSFSFVFSGLIRVVATDRKGNEYNKNFFDAGSFPGSMVALLTSAPSEFTFDALEHSSIIEIDFEGYRNLLVERHDLKLFQIHYLEKNWLLAKDAREVQLVQENATNRYDRFLKEHPSLAARLPQYHIASHLGITPTQLSRIRKKQ